MPTKAKPKTDTKQLGALYRQMLVLRQLEIRLTELSQAGALRGSLHLATGQEAVPAGACAALKKQDYLTVTYRGHGYILAKGCDLKTVVAEILGRKTGLCKGKGGKMHITDLEHGLLGANGIVGGGVPTAVGAGMSAFIDGADRVAMTVFGDGTMNQGCVHEAFNMAALWKLPVIFLCENNLYSEMTPLSESSAVTDLSARLVAYDIHAIKVDGNDVLAVKEAIEAARAKCVNGDGPVFVEAMTYRTCGHYQNDPGTGSYRTKEEVGAWLPKSPILRCRTLLLESDVTEKRLAEVEESVKAEVEEAISFALNSPEPDIADLLENVFA